MIPIWTDSFLLASRLIANAKLSELILFPSAQLLDAPVSLEETFVGALLASLRWNTCDLEINCAVLSSGVQNETYFIAKYMKSTQLLRSYFCCLG